MEELCQPAVKIPHIPLFRCGNDEVRRRKNKTSERLKILVIVFAKQCHGFLVPKLKRSFLQHDGAVAHAISPPKIATCNGLSCFHVHARFGSYLPGPLKNAPAKLKHGRPAPPPSSMTENCVNLTGICTGLVRNQARGEKRLSVLSVT